MEVLPTHRENANMKRMIQAALLSAKMHPERVGLRITALRRCLGMSKAQFADSIELNRSTLTKVEAGTRGLDILIGARIADLYGFGLDYIYRGALSDAPEGMRARVMAEIHAAKAESIELRYRTS